MRFKLYLLPSTQPKTWIATIPPKALLEVGPTSDITNSIFVVFTDTEAGLHSVKVSNIVVCTNNKGSA